MSISIFTMKLVSNSFHMEIKFWQFNLLNSLSFPNYFVIAYTEFLMYLLLDCCFICFIVCLHMGGRVYNIYVPIYLLVARGGQRSSSVFPGCISGQGLSLNLKLTISTRLAGQWVFKIFLVLFLRSGVTGHTATLFFFFKYAEKLDSITLASQLVPLPSDLPP